MTDSATPAVRTEHVWKTFHQEAEQIHAVHDVSLTIARGEFTALAGPSGSGKTTLLNVIGGLTRPSRGHVWVAGQDVTEMSNRDQARLRLAQEEAEAEVARREWKELGGGEATPLALREPQVEQ